MLPLGSGHLEGMIRRARSSSNTSKKLSIHNVFVGKLQDVIEVGIGNLVDADLAKESANLQALQIQQQLGTQALSIANSAPQILLGLFR